MTWLIDCIGKIEKGPDVPHYQNMTLTHRAYYPELDRVTTIARFKIIGIVAGVIGSVALGVAGVAYAGLLTLFAPFLFPVMVVMGALAVLVLGVCLWASCRVAHLDQEGLKRPEINEYPP